MKLKTIRVTQDDIDHGKRGSFCDCPVALAVKRAFRASLSDRRIAVRHEGIFVGDLEDERFWVAEADREVQAFIAAFDDGKRVTPRTFDMAFR